MRRYAERMNSDLDRTRLDALAHRQGLVIVEDPEEPGSFALVKPDNAGKGTDPRGERGAALAFADGVGMPLEDVANLLHGRDR